MRRYHTLLGIVVVLLASSEALSTSNEAKLTSHDTALWESMTPTHATISRSRLLRANTLDEEDNATAEERGVQSAVLGTLSQLTRKAKLPDKIANKLVIWSWLKAKMDPKAVYAELKFTGKPLAVVEADPISQTRSMQQYALVLLSFRDVEVPCIFHDDTSVFVTWAFMLVLSMLSFLEQYIKAYMKNILVLIKPGLFNIDCCTLSALSTRPILRSGASQVVARNLLNAPAASTVSVQEVNAEFLLYKTHTDGTNRYTISMSSGQDANVKAITTDAVPGLHDRV
ncbi:unnamed protein product [Phytophthora lilii]|uniref:RxLR effector protein n=1 Tax=Phytophthora lilii TaxID=2077276 RepID=A0A9W6UAS8_9STRA|nr:unnamed protein product [Phytophthora lilii]